MKRVLPPDFISKVIPFSVATCERLENTEAPGRALHYTFGDISSDGKWAWLVNGASIEIVSTLNGARLGAHCFGISSKNPNLSITCVRELKDKKNPKVLIGLDCGHKGGFLYIFDFKTSKIIRCIAFPERVTAIDIISTEGGANPADVMLHMLLRYMHGIAAVGTSDGDLYLVDLALDDDSHSDETNPGSLYFSKIQSEELDCERELLLAEQKHICFCLNAKDSGNKNPHENNGEVVITSMKYIKILSSFAVGYNNGSFQLWNLSNFTFTYVSAEDKCILPITDFAFQEPENDPRLFCYLWVMRGVPNADASQDKVSNMTMYALMFSERYWIAAIGYYYQDLQSCNIRFQYELSCYPFNPFDQNTLSSRVLHCYALRDSSNVQTFVEGSIRDDGLDSPEYSLLVVVWEAWLKDATARSFGFIGIFDLNQWYQSQMPHELRVAGNGLCSFFGIFSLEKILSTADPDFLVDVQLVPSSVAHLQLMTPCEQHFYPSSLAFRICCLTETGIIHASYLGLQQQILARFKTSGAAILMDPNDVYNMCVYSGLIPKALESPVVIHSQNQQREILLNVALENGLMEFISACINETSCRDVYISSCSPKFIMEWAWRKTGHIKSALDRLCPPLYNCSGLQLETPQVRALQFYGIQLECLSATFQLLINQSSMSTEQGFRELETKLNVVNLILLHHNVVLWFYEVGLLPEHEEGDEYGTEEFAYPASDLQKIYTLRRQELQRINQMIRGSNLLFIDNLITEIGESIVSLWEKDGGKSQYPPPNLYSLLNTYLLDGVSIGNKHRIVHYVFLDLIAHLNEVKYSHIVTQLVKFPTTFNVSPSFSRLTHAFWLLDHKDFEGAIALLVDPLINSSDIEPWQNTLIIKSFLYQGQCRKALKYVNVRQPAKSSSEDLKLHLTVLLANELICDAFQFQREFRDQANANDILQHFFLGCQQTKSLENLLQLPLNAVEEDALIHFLQESNDTHAQEILLMYFLQRSRYIQALSLNETLKQRIMIESDILSQEKATVRNMIVDGYTSIMPKVQQKLASTADFKILRKSSSLTGASKLQPLSTYIKPNDVKLTSQATLIKAVMDKVGEAWTSQQPGNYAPFRSKNKTTIPSTENIPFICTPITSRNRTQLNENPEIRFPNQVVKENESFDLDYTVSPIKRSRYMDVSPNKRRKPKFANLEVMSMLQTPPVHRKTPAARSFTNGLDSYEGHCITPQSILKVRQIVQSSLLPLPIPSTEAETDISEKMEIEYLTDNDQVDGLQKQLRFDLSNSAAVSPGNSSTQSLIPTNEYSKNSQSDDGSPGKLDVSPRRPIHFAECEGETASFSAPEKQKKDLEESVTVESENLKGKAKINLVQMKETIDKKLSSISVKFSEDLEVKASSSAMDDAKMKPKQTSELKKSILRTTKPEEVLRASIPEDQGEKSSSGGCSAILDKPEAMPSHVSADLEIERRDASQHIQEEANVVACEVELDRKERASDLPSSCISRRRDQIFTTKDNEVKLEVQLGGNLWQQTMELSKSHPANEIEPSIADVISMETETASEAMMGTAQMPQIKGENMQVDMEVISSRTTSSVSSSKPSEMLSSARHSSPNMSKGACLLGKPSAFASNALSSSPENVPKTKDNAESSDSEVLHKRPQRRKTKMQSSPSHTRLDTSKSQDSDASDLTLELSVTPISSIHSSPVVELDSSHSSASLTPIRRSRRLFEKESSSSPTSKNSSASSDKLLTKDKQITKSPSLAAQRSLESSPSDSAAESLPQSETKFKNISPTFESSSPIKMETSSSQNSDVRISKSKKRLIPGQESSVLIAITRQPKASTKEKMLVEKPALTEAMEIPPSQHTSSPQHKYNTRFSSKSPQSSSKSSSNSSPLSIKNEPEVSTQKEKKVSTKTRKSLTFSISNPTIKAEKISARSTTSRQGSSILEKQDEFVFRSPIVVCENIDDEMPNVSSTPDVKTFIFSPPLTRSRTRKGIKSSAFSKEATLSEDLSLNESKIAKTTVQSTKKQKGRTALQPDHHYSVSPINFISPVSVPPEEKKQTATKGKKSSRKDTVPKKPMVLRSRKTAPHW